MASVLSRLLTACGVVGGGLALTLRGSPVNVLIRRTPVIRFGLDTSPFLLVAASQRPESSTPYQTENQQLVVYPVQFVLAVPSDRVVQTGQDDVYDAREPLRRIFQSPAAIFAAGITECFLTDVTMDAPLARGKWLQNWDASGLTVRFSVIEPSVDLFPPAV